MEMDQNAISKNDFLVEILFILRETFEGSPEGQGSAYLDRRAGVFSTLEQLSAEQVSTEINGITIVSHVEHAKFYLDRICEIINGTGAEKINWEQSWLIETVNETEWNFLREGLRDSYEKVLQCFAGIEIWNQDNIGEAVAIIAHTAYHLGAMRHILKAVNQNENN